MPLQGSFPADDNPAFSDYAHPEALVSASWLSARLGLPGLHVIETDENRQVYDIGHIPYAHRIDWSRDLTNPVTRQLLDAPAFSALMESLGIHREDTVVIYGDRANWWAAFTFWVFKLFGHNDVRLLDGGRDAWMAEERELSFVVPQPSPSSYPVVERDDVTFRIGVAEVLRELNNLTVVDVRSPDEYQGVTPAPGVAVRGGHIPGALNIPWNTSVHANSRFRSRHSLAELYADIIEAHSPSTVFYCQFGDRSAHSWFVAHYLLGLDNVRNYDGSWAEWGNMIGMPIERDLTISPL